MFIEFKKYKKINDIHYYLVVSKDGDNYEFYIGINPKQKQISFFKSSNFDEDFISTIDFNKSEQLKIPENFISSRIYIGTMTAALRTMLKNEFPDDFNFASC